MDIEPYLAHEKFLKKHLPPLSARQRLFFAAWCCDRLWKDFGEQYLSLIGSEHATLLRDAYNDLWADLLSNRPVKHAEITSLLFILDALSEEHANYSIELGNEEAATSLCYHYTMLCAVNPSGEEALYAGLQLVELADWFCNGEMTDPIFSGEVQRQQDMITFLTNCTFMETTDRFRFREASPFWSPPIDNLIRDSVSQNSGTSPSDSRYNGCDP